MGLYRRSDWKLLDEVTVDNGFSMLYNSVYGGDMVSRYTGFTQAQREANARYDAKTYKKMLFYLRLEDDKDIIEAIQDAQAKGINKREWLREVFEKSK